MLMAIRHRKIYSTSVAIRACKLNHPELTASHPLERQKSKKLAIILESVKC